MYLKKPNFHNTFRLNLYDFHTSLELENHLYSIFKAMTKNWDNSTKPLKVSMGYDSCILSFVFIYPYLENNDLKYQFFFDNRSNKPFLYLNIDY